MAKIGIAFIVVRKVLSEADDVEEVHTALLRNQLEELGYIVTNIRKHPLNDEEVELHYEWVKENEGSK